MALSIGARPGPYEVVGSLGTGGMGEVYKAHDTRLDRNVAIKVLAPNVAAEGESGQKLKSGGLSWHA
jgi:serine/threonine protein kinase